MDLIQGLRQSGSKLIDTLRGGIESVIEQAPITKVIAGVPISRAFADPEKDVAIATERNQLGIPRGQLTPIQMSSITNQVMGMTEPIGRIGKLAKEVQPLLQEARKYKSAEEFVKSQSSKIPSLDYSASRGELISVPTTPNQVGNTVLISGEFSKGDNYLYHKYKEIAEGSEITVFRASDKKGLRPGDMMTSQKELAKEYADAKNRTVFEYKIPRKDIKVDKLTGYFVYTPDGIKSLTDIWNKANKATPIPPYKETGSLTTKILKDLEGKSTVSKQYILDSTNRGDLKQVERDVTRQVLDTMPDQVNVKEFADKVKSELLPLERVSSFRNRSQLFDPNEPSKTIGQSRYENIVLPDELRGSVKDYRENVFTSPITTSAGDIHFSHTPLGSKDNYFGHTRIEDMADNSTRRVIEVQSDLYQKGNLEKELDANDFERLREATNHEKAGNIKTAKRIRDEVKLRQDEVSKLQQYNDPTAHFRMVREEIKKAAQDGKTKLQFPTGETAMKIEGLGSQDSFHIARVGNNIEEAGRQITPENIKVGLEVVNNNDKWIIIDVLGDGKFKAIPKQYYNDKVLPNNLIEEFDISGKVDTSNPIYKFYEKDIGKYLSNKYGAKRVTDDKGVSWYELGIDKSMKGPVEAYGKIDAKTLAGAGLATTGVLGGVTTGLSLSDKLRQSDSQMVNKLREEPKPIILQDRGVQIKPQDIEQVLPTIFAEVSNRTPDKIELEVRTILNTAINRIKDWQNKRGVEKGLVDIMHQPNQYQGFNSDQYKKFVNGQLDFLGQKKADLVKQIIDKVVKEMESGIFTDNVTGAVNYIHKPDGRIIASGTTIFK